MNISHIDLPLGQQLRDALVTTSEVFTESKKAEIGGAISLVNRNIERITELLTKTYGSGWVIESVLDAIGNVTYIVVLPKLESMPPIVVVGSKISMTIALAYVRLYEAIKNAGKFNQLLEEF